MPYANKDEVIALMNFGDLFLNPKEYGCAFDKGDPATYQERAGHIIDAGIAAINGIRNSKEFWSHHE